MDANEEQVLNCLRNMGNSDEEELNENGYLENGHSHNNNNNNNNIIRHSSYPPGIKVSSLHWLDLRVFYVRLSKCVIDDDSTPEYLTLNHVPMNRDTLLEMNCVRTSIYSDGVSTLLKRDRLDKRSEEVTFVSTDSIRMSGSTKFEVFHREVLVLSGMLELNHSIGESRQNWSMFCESDIPAGTGFLKGNQNNQYAGMESNNTPAIEVYLAGCFSGSPIILSKSLQLSHRRKQLRKGMLESIPECEVQKDESSSLTMQSWNNAEYRPQEEGHCSPYLGIEYLEGEDGELSWFNAGVRVGVGIGLSICLGLGIGVGLIARTYQGTTTNFRRRLI